MINVIEMVKDTSFQAWCKIDIKVNGIENNR